MAQDALERLFNSNNQSGESIYSIEEQMNYSEDDDFLNGMSSEAENALFKSVSEVTLDENNSNNNEEYITEELEEDDTIVIDAPGLTPTPSKEELFNNNTEDTNDKKTRKPRKPKNETNTTTTVSNAFNPIMDQLSKDIIDDLRKSNYKINRFNNDTMEIVFNYMYDKF